MRPGELRAPGEVGRSSDVAHKLNHPPIGMEPFEAYEVAVGGRPGDVDDEPQLMD